MSDSPKSQSGSNTELSQEVMTAALMFEKLSPEAQKTLIELMRQIATKN